MVLITVVVGSATVVAPNDAPHVIALAVPLSVKRNSIKSPSTGVPDRLVVIEVIAAASPVKFIMSTLSVFVVGVAPGAFVVVRRRVMRLLVSVFVELILGMTTPSTARTPAAERDRVVSEALPNSIDPVVVIVPSVGELVLVTMLLPSMAATPADTLVNVVSEAAPNSSEPTPRAVDVEDTRPAIGKPVALVRVPDEGVPKAPSKVTNAPAEPTFTASAVATFVPSPDIPDDTGSPVQFVNTPDVGVPSRGVTRVGEVASTTDPEPVVEAADIAVPLPERIPVMVVVSVIAGVVVAVATVPAKPLADTTDTDVTVPEAEAASVSSLPVIGSTLRGSVTVESVLD